MIDYAIYGGKLKRDYPNRFLDLSDSQVGRAWVEIHGFDSEYYAQALDEYEQSLPAPPAAPVLDPDRTRKIREVSAAREVPRNPAVSAFPETFEPNLQQFDNSLDVARQPHVFWFPKWRKEHVENTTAHKSAQYARARQVVTDEFAVRNHPRRLCEIEELARQSHDMAMLGGEVAQNQLRRADQLQKRTEGLQAQLIRQAYSRKLDLQTFNQVRLQEENARVETAKAAKMDENRLKAYEDEVQIDLRAALAQKLITHEQVLGIKARLHSLIIERGTIEQNDKVSEATKKRLLESQDEVIRAFQEDLDVQMARHLLKGPQTKENLEAADKSTEGAADYPDTPGADE